MTERSAVRDHAATRRACGPAVTERPRRRTARGRAHHHRGPGLHGHRRRLGQLLAETDFEHDDRIVINMGPQHPSTHGVLRLVLELEGETVTQARSVIGYLHTGIEKNCEYRTWTQGVTFVTRMDYLAPLFNEAAYCLARREAARHRGAAPRAGRSGCC